MRSVVNRSTTIHDPNYHTIKLEVLAEAHERLVEAFVARLARALYFDEIRTEENYKVASGSLVAKKYFDLRICRPVATVALMKRRIVLTAYSEHLLVERH